MMQASSGPDGQRIAFLGLGNMGLPMARNLARAGHRVTGFDVVPAILAKAEAAGLTPATSVKAAIADVDFVITSLPGDAQARAVYAEVTAGAKRGALLIDTSTIDVATTRDLNAKAAAAGLSMIDAPVSGGVAGAEAATLTFMVGGRAEDVSRAEPLLRHMGKAVIHTGEAGTGEAAKLCNNMMLGIQMIGVAEGFVLAEKLGLDPARLFEVVKQSTPACWSITVQNPVPGIVATAPASKGYAGGFATALALKDLKLAQQAAQGAGAATPLGAAAAALYALHAQGAVADKPAAGLDFSSIYTMLRGKAS